MLKNYIKIAWRNLQRNKAISSINIFGLAVGIACCLIITGFVTHELSYDRFNEKADQIVRVVFKGSINGGLMKEANVMPPVAQTLKADFPEVLDATRLRINNASLIAYKEKTIREYAIANVDSNFFNVFTLPFVIGNPKTALLDPRGVVITEEIARKYFGSENPIGKVLQVKTWNNATLKVTGVIKKIPVNSHFKLDFFVSMAGVPDAKSNSWLTSNYYTYLVLQKGYDYKKLEAKLQGVVEKYMGPQILKDMGMSLAQFRKNGNDLGLFLQPLTDIHLRSDFSDNLQPPGDIKYVYIFSSIAVFILLIACINFMNLATAGASKRAKEVGVRKVLGSVKIELVRQFLVESFMLTAFALIAGVVLMYIGLPLFNQLSGKEIEISFLNEPILLPALILFGLFVAIIAGSYPAFYLSSFNPIAVLKGKLTTGMQSIGLRSGLVVFQFFISILLIVGSTVVYKQLKFIQNKKLGYDKDRVLVLHETYLLDKNEEVFRRELLRDSRIKNISISGYIPAGEGYSNNNSVYTDDNPDKFIKTLKYNVDEHYIPTLGMQISAGRNFSKAFATDSGGAIINETAAKAFGWENNAVGRTVTQWGNNIGKKVSFKILGIVKDFHFKSLHERISPLMMTIGRNSGSMLIKISGENPAPVLASIKNEWNKFSNPALFSHSFLDERLEATYSNESKLGRILGICAGLTIFIACLGLFGLVKFAAEQRTKEIGIRKVLGATVANVTAMLSKDFLKLVCIALIFASPIAYFAIDKWLQDYAYRIEIQWWMFAFAGLTAVAVALLTISFQAVKAGLANPVKSLRAE